MGRVMLRHTRPTTLLTATAALVLTGALGAATADRRRGPGPDHSGAGPDLRLAAPPGEAVRSATVRLGADRLHPAGRGARTDRLTTATYSMVGFTWRGPDPGVELRTRTDGKWTGWRQTHLLADGLASDGRTASTLLWVDRSRGIQVRTTNRAARALDLVLIDPGALPSDTAATSTSPRRLARATGAPPPQLHTRKEWGANPDWRNGRPVYLDQLKQIHVHHTATGNDYSRADVPGILRGMYRYHTQTLGWFDIGYNFLVDRFGRAWVGRSGGTNRLVRGAHTLGFNHSSVGIAVIGNLEAAGTLAGGSDPARAAGRLEAGQVWPRRRPHGQRDLDRQRQVPGRHHGAAAGDRRPPRHQRHGVPRGGLRQAAGDPRPDPAAYRQLVKPGAGQNPVAEPL